jgi:hypothetical protein
MAAERVGLIRGGAEIMNRATLRPTIIATAVVTALVHLGMSGLFNFGLDPFGILFVLNALGYLALLAALLLIVSTWMHLRAAA